MKCTECNQELTMFSQRGTFENPLCYSCENRLEYGIEIKKDIRNLDLKDFYYQYKRNWRLEISILSIVVIIAIVGILYQLEVLPILSLFYGIGYFGYLFTNEISSFYISSEIIIYQPIGGDYMFISRDLIDSILRISTGSYKNRKNLIILKNKEDKELLKIVDTFLVDKKLRDKLLLLAPVIDKRKYYTI